MSIYCTVMTFLAGYELLDPLSATVYEARDPNGEPCVVARIELASAPEVRAMQRRLLHLAGIHHRHIVKVRDTQVQGHTLLVAYEPVSGISLGTLLAARGQLQAGEIAYVWDAVASALATLHDAGVIHGDVSLENIIITDDGVPVLVDICARLGAERGTAGFTAPERAQGGAASVAGDIYSLAAVLCELSPAALVRELTEQALHSEPERRPTARDFSALSAHLGPGEAVAFPSASALAVAYMRKRTPATQVAPSRRRHARPGKAVIVHRHRLRWIWVAAGAAAAVLSGGYWWAQPAAGEVLAELLSKRDAAIIAGDPALLEGVYAAGAPALDADTAQITQWNEQHIAIENLQTQVQVREVRGNVVTAYVTASAYQERQGEVRTDKPVQERCLQFTLELGRIREIHPCAGEE